MMIIPNDRSLFYFVLLYLVHTNYTFYYSSITEDFIGCPTSLYIIYISKPLFQRSVIMICTNIAQFRSIE